MSNSSLNTSRCALPLGTVLEQCTLIRVCGEGGFGVTYQAEDRSVSPPRIVAVKEIFPAGMVYRAKDGSLRADSPDREHELARMLDRFEREGKILAALNHPNIVKVHRRFRANRTFYLVLEFIEGKDLHEMASHRGSPSPEQVMKLLHPLLDALKYLHQNQVFHRDIKPPNIRYTKGRGPVLIDFGSAREETRSTHSFHLAISRGFSPFELYSNDWKGHGAWSDIYSLSATMLYLITLRLVPDASDRYTLGGDAFPWKNELLSKGFSPHFVEFLRWGMMPRSEHRPHTVEKWCAALSGGGAKPPSSPPGETPLVEIDNENREPQQDKPPSSSKNKQSLHNTRKSFAVLVAVGIMTFCGALWMLEPEIFSPGSDAISYGLNEGGGLSPAVDAIPPHPPHPNLVYQGNGRWQPAPGYEWEDKAAPDNYKVRPKPVVVEEPLLAAFVESYIAALNHRESATEIKKLLRFPLNRWHEHERLSQDHWLSQYEKQNRRDFRHYTLVGSLHHQVKNEEGKILIIVPLAYKGEWNGQSSEGYSIHLLLVTPEGQLLINSCWESGGVNFNLQQEELRLAPSHSVRLIEMEQVVEIWSGPPRGNEHEETQVVLQRLGGETQAVCWDKAIRQPNGDWFLVRLSGGTLGFVHGRHLRDFEKL